MKGIHKNNPMKPRYQATWDVSIVLRLLTSWMPLNSLTLKNLTFKLVALITLASAARAQTLKALRVDKCIFQNDSVSFNCGDKLKTSKPGTDFVLYLKRFEKEELCPVKTLKAYLVKTKNLRKDKQLFVSFVNYKPVTTSTIARWLKNVLSLAGISVEIYKAHSYSSASSSAAVRAGCKLKDIMKTADWSSVKNFKKFYLRDVEEKVEETNYSKYVLSKT